MSQPNLHHPTTVLNLGSLKLGLMLAGAVITALFTLMNPELTLGLSFLERGLFWSYKVGAALLAILVASKAMGYLGLTGLRPFTAVTLCGLVGAIIVTPAYALADILFPLADHDDSDWLEALERSGAVGALAAEFLCASPKIMAAWYAVNLPFFISNFKQPPTLSESGPSNQSNADLVEQKREQDCALIRQELYEKLPAVIGQDLVVISSDLHYLKVVTKQGDALVLGSLRRYANALEEQGLQVHRSHWVAKTEVVRFHIAGEKAYCLMSNGQKIPVSRSHRKLVKAYFGLLLSVGGEQDKQQTSGARQGQTSLKCVRS